MWIKISSEVICLSPHSYYLPFMKSVNDGNVDMFWTPNFYTCVEADLTVFKRNLGIHPFWEKPFTFDEIAFFICDNWTTWRGQEFGFRFPMHAPPNIITAYVQNPFGLGLWFEYPIFVADLDAGHNYRIGVTDDLLRCVSFLVDDRVKAILFGRIYPKPFQPVICCHTRYDGMPELGVAMHDFKAT